MVRNDEFGPTEPQGSSDEREGISIAVSPMLPVLNR